MTILLTKKQAAARVALHPEYLMTLAKQGKFPQPVKYAAESNSSVRFVESEVSDWIAAKVAERGLRAADHID